MIRKLGTAVVLAGFLSTGAAYAASGPNLSVALDNGVTEIKGPVVYGVQVVNKDRKPVPANVRVTFPQGLTGLSAEGASLTATHASWTVALAPGSNTFKLGGTLTAPPAGTQAVAATACVYVGDMGKPLVCSTDIDSLGPAEPAVSYGLIGGILLLCLVGGAAGTTVLYKRSRRAIADTAPAVEEREPAHV